MLCLKLRDGDSVRIGDDTEIVVAIEGRRAVLKIRAPEDVPIRRIAVPRAADGATS